MFPIRDCSYIFILFPFPVCCDVGGSPWPEGGPPEEEAAVEGDGDHGGVEGAGDQVDRAQAPLHRLQVRA